MWHAFIILTKVILGIVWAILETDTWEPLVELTRNDPAMLKLAVFFIICALILKIIPSNVTCAAGALLKWHFEMALAHSYGRETLQM